MKEANFENKAGEALSWLEIRELVGIPSQDEIAIFMQQKFPLIRSGIIKIFTEEQDIVLLKQLLEEHKLDVQKNLGVNLSKPLLCAVFLSRIVGDELTSEARNAFNESNMENFRFFHDASTGLMLSCNRVRKAEAELSDDAGNARLAIVSYEGDKLEISVAEQTQQYLYMKREAAESLELLCKDPSGFLLMDDYAERVKAGSWGISAYITQEYKLAGAELARDLYKSLYEIAAPLYPQGQFK